MASNEKLTYSMDEAMDALRLSRASLYKQINEGLLRTYSVGRRRYCTRQAIIDFQSHLESSSMQEN